MSSFAEELSEKLTGHSSFWEYFGRLQGFGVTRTLQKTSSAPPFLEAAELLKLLYCASVFTQTNSDRLKGIAQTIALNTLLVHKDSSLRERGLHILTELGNFPGLRYAEREIGVGDETLLGLLNRRVSQQLNTVKIGNQSLPLTDYQKRVWDKLPYEKAIAISAPTSAGKSFLVIEHLCQQAELHSKFIAVYIAPTRALLSEVHQKVQDRLKGRDSIRITTVPSLDPLNRDQQILILTQERLQVFLAVWGGDFDMVIVDEAQNLADAARGMILQDCLATIAAKKKGTRFIMLAPGVVGLPEVAKTIGIPDLIPESTAISPVLQNRIVIRKVKGRHDEMELSVLRGAQDRVPLGTVKSSQGLDNSTTRLAAIALELGGDSGSLVYETGPYEAEKTAARLMNGLKARGAQPIEPALNDLSKFIQQHIHKEYVLASMVQFGVGYHYGRMPSLLREALETSFKKDKGGLRYLVCTTTLAQGINLPARNVFIDTPKRGRGRELDPALLWNFAGRAGRLNHDIVGNVFLLDYDEWVGSPMDEFVPFSVESAVTATLSNTFDGVVKAIKGEVPRVVPWDETATRVRACAGLLIAKAAKSEAKNFIASVLPAERPDDGVLLESLAQDAVTRIGLPADLLAANWTIDPYGLRRLYDRIVTKIAAGEFDDLIPLNPHSAPSGLYQGIFNRIFEEVFERKDKFAAMVAGLAIAWMKGTPYPEMLGNWVKNALRRHEAAVAKAAQEGAPIRGRKNPPSVDTLIREAFGLIEDVVRFQFVQLGKAYGDLLNHALRQSKNADRISGVYDFALALELGISTGTGTAFVELGLSRITASVLEDLFPNSSLNVQEAREALKGLDVDANRLSPIIVAELERLGLRKSLAA